MVLSGKFKFARSLDFERNLDLIYRSKFGVYRAVRHLHERKLNLDFRFKLERAGAMQM